MEKVTRVADEDGVVIFSKSSCCLSYTVEILFQELGVRARVHELDNDPEGKEMEKAIARMGCDTIPSTFIGGKLVGSTKTILSLHLSGTLSPMIKPYQTMI